MGAQWKNANKAAAAAKKGSIITKIAKEIQVASRMGGTDPAYNARLRLALEHAKKNSVPNDTIDRAIKKGAGLLEGQAIEEITYEGYGPHGIGVIVECQSDNRNRTAPDMRHLFKSHGGNLGETGSVMWMFQRISLIEATKTGSFDPEEEAIEVGANEVEKSENGYEFYGAAEDLASIQAALQGRGWKVTAAELSYKPSNITELSETQMKEVQEFLQELENNDDTHRVYATLK